MKKDQQLEKLIVVNTIENFWDTTSGKREKVCVKTLRGNFAMTCFVELICNDEIRKIRF